MAAFASFLLGLLLRAASLRGRQGVPGWSGAMTRALLFEEVLLHGVRGRLGSSAQVRRPMACSTA